MTQEELVSSFKSGVINDDTYCWKDGMADWAPIREIGELAGAFGGVGGGIPDQTQQEPAAPEYGAAGNYGAGSEHDDATQAGYSGYGGQAQAASTNGNGATNGMFGSSPAPAAARRQGGRGAGGADLFGGVAQAGGEDDVMTSAPHGVPQSSGDPGKLTGQRNENSVLFSLNALTQSAPKEEAPAGPGEGSGLIDIRALSASMGNTGPTKSGHVDDIMNLGGGGAFGAALTAPVLAPPMMDGGLGFDGTPRKDNTKLMLIGIIGAAVILALVIVLVAVLRKPAEPLVAAPVAAPTDTTAASAASAAAAPSATAPTPSASVAANDNAAAPQPPGQTAGGGGGDTTHHHHGGGGGGGTGGALPAFVAPAPAAPAAAPKSAGGGSLADQMKSAAGPDNTFGGGGGGGGGGSSAPFDRGAAAAALGSVNVAGCKKSDGPTGSGHIKITFAPTGSVASAQVDQPPFAGTAVGGCVAGKFRSAHIPAFAGSSVTVGKSFNID
jgi:hypothetical protein